MSFQFKLPQISGNDPSVQISSIQQYLYKLVEELNHSMNVLDSSITETSEKIVATEKKNKQTTEAEAQASFDSLKGLIIKSADIVNAYYQKMKLRFDGVYTAQSVFGDFVEQTNTAIELANNGIAVNTQSIGVINSNIVEMEDDIEALDDDVNGANGLTPRMQIAESNITTNANNITLKVAQSEYDTDMASVNAAIATKASAQDLSTLAGRVSTAESTISQQADQIALRVTTETYNGGISNLQGQVDGKIESWHYNYAPTTTNYPASEWTTAALKEKHKGDLFYNTDSGYMYRYEILEPEWSQLNGINWSELGNVTWEDLIDEYGEYGWKEVLDANLIEKVINESSITIDGDRINIQADNIHLEGYTTINEGFSIDQQGNMTCKSATITDGTIEIGNNFSVDELGNITSKGGSIGGWKLNSNALYSEYRVPSDAAEYAGVNFKTYIQRYLQSAGNDTWIFSVQRETEAGSGVYRALFKVDGKGAVKAGRADIDYAAIGRAYFSEDFYPSIATAGDIQCAGTVTAQSFNPLSTEKVKKNIEPSGEMLEKVLSSDIYSFNYKTEEDEEKKHYGLIIGENYRTMDEVISKKGDSIDIYTMTSVLWKAVQELSAKIEDLETQINSLQGGI